MKTNATTTLTIRAVTDAAGLAECKQLEQAVWGAEHPVPLPVMIATNHAGGLTAGAYLDGELVGYAYSFPGVYRGPDGQQPQQHSHILAVLPGMQGRGIGQRLKQFQAGWCLENGYELMTWTFDPLRARNAYLNLELLGATAEQYYENHYGNMGDAQNHNLETDRLLAVWRLRDRPRPDGRQRMRPDPTALPAALPHAGELPGPVTTNLDADEVLLAIPADIGALLASDLQACVLWRARTREAFQHYFARGYRAARYVAGSYVLERWQPCTT